MSSVIETRGLEKRFGRVRALDGLDLTVAPGEVHGFLGPNGAGKSTTIRVLLGLYRPSGGTAAVFGQNPWTDAVALHRRIAYVPGDVSLWPNLSGGEAIDLLCRLRGGTADAAAYRARRAHLVDAFQLDPTKKGRTYSKGNRQKVALIAALAAPADLFIFDEPTSGLDPLMDAVFRRELQAATADGAAVLLSSHILSEVEHLCDRVSIIRAGRTVETGTLAQLRHLTRTEVAFASTGLTDADLAGLAARIPAAHDLVVGTGVPQTATTHVGTARAGTARAGVDRVSFTADSDALPEVLPVLAELRVQGLTVAPPSLETLFLRHYREDAPALAPAPLPSTGPHL
ncbi:ABC transporter ATP-binding protein [Cryobacterium sp. TMT3-29-2]|uniref:ABC transporter ATP-binding protein n=1 Tax=Cryobacterium sp. TMT3-29-2 TaxID=2555867 RepID=UPI00107488AD|nr:ABC transporter ATP-binding protein [Cryobacterium sp. TMT3-29-2]TFC94259.1 ABC transporter ATP-binding protein [Cryobacterium sp. TMT3-29-2]